MPHLRRILAVDDNARNLAILEKALADEFELVTVNSGNAALEVAPRFRPDLVLLDVMMSGLDGYETCRRLRTHRSLAGCKVIMLSARATATDRLEGYAAGADDYVTKPFDSDELLAKLRVYLRLKSVEEVDRLKTDLLHLLAHETRTPLSSVLTPCELLLETQPLTDEQRSLVGMIHRGGQRLLTLVEKVSFLSQLKAGLLPLVAESRDAGGLLRSAVESAVSHTGRQDVRVESHVEPGLTCHGDPSLVHRALQAILDNALRLSPPSGTVRVTFEQRGPWATCSITDHGPGLAAEFLDRVFDEFAIHDIHHHHRGHGLSLATARIIAEQHAGDLNVRSEPGSGTTFVLRLPAPDTVERAA